MIVNIDSAIAISNRTGFRKLTPLLQVLVTRKYFASGCSFPHVYGKLIGVVQDRLVYSPAFNSNLLWGEIRIFMIIQKMKVAENNLKSTKLSVQQMTDSEQPTKSTANQHQVF